MWVTGSSFHLPRFSWFHEESVSGTFMINLRFNSGIGYFYFQLDLHSGISCVLYRFSFRTALSMLFPAKSSAKLENPCSLNPVLSVFFFVLFLLTAKLSERFFASA